jgi:hypothetical protein
MFKLIRTKPEELAILRVPVGRSLPKIKQPSMPKVFSFGSSAVLVF